MLKKMISFVAVAGLVLALAGSVQAAQYTWNGGAGATWDTTGTNWVGGPVNPWNAANGGTNDALFDTSGATASVSGTVYTNGITFDESATISNGTITLAGTDPTVRLDRNSTINSVLAGSTADVTLENFRTSSSTRLTLNAANTYTGVTNLTGPGGQPYSYFRAGDPEAFGPAASANLNFPSTAGQRRIVVELYGNDITIVGLNTSAANDGGGWGQFGTFVINNSSTDCTLTVNTSVDSSYNGFLGDVGSGTLALVKDGPATLYLQGHNTYSAYSGGLTIKDGTVESNRGGSVWGSGPITMGDTGTTGTLQQNHNSNQSISRPITLAAGGTGAFQVDGAGYTLTLSGVIDGAGNLMKTGPGRLRLSNLSNAYTGDTRILAGVLETNGDFLADSASVYLTAGATMDLDFVGTDTIGGLFFDAAPQDLGTWGRIGSGADNESDFFTSDGLLNVIPEPASAVLLLLGLPFVMRRKRR